MPVHKEAMSDKKQPPPACTVAVILKRMQRGEVREDMHMCIYIYVCEELGRIYRRGKECSA